MCFHLFQHMKSIAVLSTEQGPVKQYSKAFLVCLFGLFWQNTCFLQIVKTAFDILCQKSQFSF